MDKYCHNPLCDSEAVKDVKVSVNRPSDEKRSLCACCEEVFLWGVQHGKMLSGGQAHQRPHGRMTVVPVEEKGPASLWWVVHTIEVSAADAQMAAALAYQFMKDPQSPLPVLEVANGNGNVTRVDLSQTQERSSSKEDDPA